MQLLLQREPTVHEVTYGKLYVNDKYECETLEDSIREVPKNMNESVGDWYSRWKVLGKTAIPAARYEVLIDYSSRFHRLMPHIVDPPGMNILNGLQALMDQHRGFSGVRIHSLNTAAQTEGCVGVGKERVNFGSGDLIVPGISMSRLAFDALFTQLKSTIPNDERIWIDIRNPQS